MLRRRVSRLPLRSPGNSGNPMAMPIHRHHFPGSLLLALLLLGGTAGAADGTHVPAPLNLEADLRDGRLQLSLLIDRYLFRHWTGIDVRTLPELGDEEYEERCEEVARFLAIHAPVAIDAIDVRPVIEDLAYLEGTQDTDFLEFAEFMVIDALTRDESAGGHFREEHQTDEGEARRDDENFTHVSAWEFTGVGNEPRLHKEPLDFRYVPPTQRSYK